MCIRPIEDKSPGLSLFYAGYNIKKLSDINIPKELIINVLTFDSNPIFEIDAIYLMNIKYSAERLTNKMRHSMNRFFNKFNALKFNSLKHLILFKMPPYFDSTSLIDRLEMEHLYLEHRIHQDSFEEHTSIKRLHLIVNPGAYSEIELPPNLECLIISSSTEGVTTTSNELAVSICAQKCTKLRHM